MRSSIFRLAAVMVAFLNVYACQQFVSHGAHTLYRFPEWVSAKSAIPNGLVTAQEFVFERQTLAGDQLNLGAWNGFNEVRWNNDLQWTTLNFHAELGENAYLWIFFGEGKGFRLSRNPNYASGYFELNGDKQFTAREEFKFDNARDFSIDNHEGIKLAADGKLLFAKNGNFAANPRVIFRSGLAPVSVDNVFIKNANESRSENFSPRAEWLMALVLVSLIYVFCRTFSLQLLFLVISVTFWQLDTKLWSYNYYEPAFTGVGIGPVNDFRTQMEIVRKKCFFYLYKIFGDEQSVLVLQKKNYMSKFFIPENTRGVYNGNGLEENSERVRQKFITSSGQVTFLNSSSELPKDTTFKIGFFGSSQTFGGGAQSMDKSFPALAIKELSRCATRPISAYNFSEPGVDTGFMLEKYRQLLGLWQPDLLIVNMAHNDRDNLLYREHLVKLLEMNKAKKIATVFILEPNTPELGFNPLSEKHAILKELDPHALDLQQFLSSAEVRDTGLMWWDIVHFDQAGHAAAGQWLATELKRLKVVPCR